MPELCAFCDLFVSESNTSWAMYHMKDSPVSFCVRRKEICAMEQQRLALGKEMFEGLVLETEFLFLLGLSTAVSMMSHCAWNYD